MTMTTLPLLFQQGPHPAFASQCSRVVRPMLSVADVGPGEGTPSSEAHLGLFGGGKKVSEQEFRRPHHNHLSSINAEIDRRDDGSVLIARRILGNQRAKIRWGLLTP
jgi:hypothetical protein